MQAKWEEGESPSVINKLPFFLAISFIAVPWRGPSYVRVVKLRLIYLTTNVNKGKENSVIYA